MKLQLHVYEYNSITIVCSVQYQFIYIVNLITYEPIRCISRPHVTNAITVYSSK